VSVHGTYLARERSKAAPLSSRYQQVMHEIIYLIGLVVVVMFVLGLLGLR
jgi:hypothetical protein